MTVERTGEHRGIRRNDFFYFGFNFRAAELMQ